MSLERSPKLTDLHEDITRRGALQFIARVGASIAAIGAGIGVSPQAQAAERSQTYDERVDKIIGDISRVFGKGGAAARTLETGEGLTVNVIGQYLNWLSAASAGLQRAYDHPRDSSPLEKHLVRSTPSGLNVRAPSESEVQATMKNALPGTKPPAAQSNSYMAKRGGKKYEVTARHAIRAGEGFFYVDGGPDVAVRDSKHGYADPAFDFDQADNDEDLAGKVGVIIGTDIQGNISKIHTPFIKATPALLKLLVAGFGDPAKTNYFTEALQYSYLCVLPPEWGYANEYGLVELAGMSGSFSAVHNDSGDLVPSGPLMSVQKISNACMDFAGTCATIGFVSRRSTVADTIDAYERIKRVINAKNARQ